MKKRSRKHLVEFEAKSLEIQLKDTIEAKSLGFVARNLIQATLPHKKVDDILFSRKNGEFTLSIIGDQGTGVPFGSYPRIILCWLVTEVIKKKSRTITLGNSLTDFMKNVGISVSAGKNGSFARFKEQVKRLFSSTIKIEYHDEKAGRLIKKNINIADNFALWWDPVKPRQSNFFSSQVTLSEQFFMDIIAHPVPIDLRIVRLFKQSSFTLDLYFWLTYRMSYLAKPTRITLETLMLQFGAGYNNDRKGRHSFKKNLELSLAKIKVQWPSLRIKIENDLLIMMPSPTLIKFKQEYLPRMKPGFKMMSVKHQKDAL